MAPTGPQDRRNRERELARKAVNLAAAHRDIGLLVASDFDLMLVRLLIGPATPKLIAKALGDADSDRLRPRLFNWLRKEEFNQYFRKREDDYYFLTLSGQRRAREIVRTLDRRRLLGD